jgi:hypothetical protein
MISRGDESGEGVCVHFQSEFEPKPRPNILLDSDPSHPRIDGGFCELGAGCANAGEPL